MAPLTTCPACNYTRRSEDSGIVPDWQCPMCQKAYNKSNRSEPLQQMTAPTRPCTDYIQVSIKGDEFLENASQILFNGSQDVDPVAMRTRWSPVINDRTGMDQRELIEVSPERVEFRRTKGSLVFGYCFIIMGSLSAFCSITTKRAFSSEKEMLALGISILFIVAGVVFLKITNKLVVFDKTRGCLWKGRIADGKPHDTFSDQDLNLIEDIHALQLIYWQTQSVSGQRRLLRIVELNLVLRNARRVNVSAYQAKSGILFGGDHDIEKKPLEDALTLGRFLGKPVWDAIESTKHYWNKERRWLDPDPVGKTSADPVETTLQENSPLV